MKKIILITWCIMIWILYAPAQTKPKPKEKTPAAIDINEMMKEAQKALGEYESGG